MESLDSQNLRTQERGDDFGALDQARARIAVLEAALEESAKKVQQASEMIKKMSPAVWRTTPRPGASSSSSSRLAEQVAAMSLEDYDAKVLEFTGQ